MAKTHLGYQLMKSVRKVLDKYANEKDRRFIINQMTYCWKIGYQQGKNARRLGSPRS